MMLHGSRQSEFENIYTRMEHQASAFVNDLAAIRIEITNSNEKFSSHPKLRNAAEKERE